jgi:hypothetical protein
MGSQIDKKKPLNIASKIKKIQKVPIEKKDNSNQKLEDIIDENIITLKKVHAILLNCVNLTKKQKLEFAESERYFMKLYLKKFQRKIHNSE